MHTSIATITSPEFINLQPLDINPLMSSCEIKVLYLGENRNHSYITKDVATEMAKTLRGAPIVGYYKNNKEDFHDHGNEITFDEDGVHFACKTVPYGFVAPDAQVWFKDFEDVDEEKGTKTVRTYMMTTGFLWTGQFEEAKLAVTGAGRPQSMELDEQTLQGNWATNDNGEFDFFIINDAIFSKLCILGEDVEPCFEGSSIKSPVVSKSFTLDDEFKNTLYQMMQDLRNFALKGGQANMENIDEIKDNSLESEVIENQDTVETNFEDASTETDAPAESDGETVADAADEPVALAEEEEDEETEEETKTEDDDVYDSMQKKIFDLESEVSTLQSTIASLQAENESLKSYKAKIEDAEKDAKIAEFYMLDDSDEDKMAVIANKSQYTVDEIESKLATLCFKKKLNFTIEEKASEVPMTFSLAEEKNEVAPDWITFVDSLNK